MIGHNAARRLPTLVARIALHAAACAGALAVLPSAGAPLAPDHPILGTWTMTNKDGTCAETYRFRPDGTIVVTSGEEIAEIDYEISATASPKGFYRWHQRVAKDNGKLDCSGKVTNVGESVTWYIQFDAAGERMIICQAESTQACFGPMRRVRGTRT